MDIIFIINIFIVVLSILVSFITWKIYKISKARSILWLFIAMVYMSILRILMTINFVPYPVQMPLPFYIFFVIGMWGLWRTLKKFIK